MRLHDNWQPAIIQAAGWAWGVIKNTSLGHAKARKVKVNRGERLDKIEACVADVVAIADAIASQDLAQAKIRIELLFADADQQASGHFTVAERLRDRIGLALNEAHRPAAKQFLLQLIAWLDREHLGRAR